jgi:hypothetical protein
MNTPTVSAAVIHSVQNQYHQLHTALETLNRHNGYDIYVRAGTVLIAAITAAIALRLFYLNKKKDFHIKKAEIAGDIYSLIFEFKRLKLVIWKNEIMNDIYLTAQSKVKNPDQKILAERLFYHETEDSPEYKIPEYQKGLDTVRMNLLGKIGQYRFYVSRGEKAALKFHSNAVTINREIPSLLTDEEFTFEHVIREHWDVVESEMNKEKNLLEKQFGAIEAIIDDYDRYTKDTDLFTEAGHHTEPSKSAKS